MGNFVETKKATVGKSSKISHLSYIGDAQLGDNVNIGAGTITCNYDGDKKHPTQVGDDVFVGSNSTLVAPLCLSDGAFVAAGSTITKTVGNDELGIGRAKQRNISSWKSPAKKGKKHGKATGEPREHENQYPGSFSSLRRKSGEISKKNGEVYGR